MHEHGSHELRTLIQRVEAKWARSPQAEQKDKQASSQEALSMLHRYWRQVPSAERLRFLCEMLTPNERRALQYGFEDPAS